MEEISESLPEKEPPDSKSQPERLEDVRLRARRELAARLGIMREMANGHNPPRKPRENR